MITFKGPTAEVYDDVMSMLIAEPTTSSRSGKMREVLNVSIESQDPRMRYLWRDDSWNLAFQLQEHFAYWEGLNPGHVDRYVDMSQWLDDDGKLPGSAYGERMRHTAGHDQIARVIHQLRENPETRRAVIQVHQASEENYYGADVSCTESLQFLMRNGELHLTANIRSQDMYWGYCYDAANNQFLQEIIAGILQCDVGTYTHNMVSCHYYTEFEEKVMDSLSTATAHEMPDMRISKRHLSNIMHELNDGLILARGGVVPVGEIQLLNGEVQMLDQYDALAFADWLRTMTSYELQYKHNSPQRGAKIAHDVHTDWMRHYLLKK